ADLPEEISQRAPGRPVMSQASLLAEGISALGLSLSPAQHEKLLAYVALLQRWNAAYNLTAVRTPEEMIVRHLLDSLAVAPWVEPTALLDVGTGAGLPGIPLAIAHPGLQVTMLDSNGKKTRFVKQAILELGLRSEERRVGKGRGSCGGRCGS